MYCLEGVACTNFMPHPHSVFFIWVSPLHILNAPVYLTINYKYNSDDSWVPRNGFLNNYWPHFFIRSFLFFFSIPHTKTTFWSSFVGVLSDWCQKMLWFACVRPFFHPFCLHICKYVQHSDGHWLKKMSQSSLPWPTFWPLLVHYDVKTEELKDHMVISGSNWGSRFSSKKGILVILKQR